MLAEIMKAFRETGRPLDLNELSKSLGAERSAVEGMLQTLVRQGKLREISPGSEDCIHCGGRADCARWQSGPMGRVYELPENSR
ncbi:MAG: hypothetical protein A2Z05_00880 [Chloroflexi bacterium RBG_16_60_22]|nr:MAG: hypothetical protein A2Z05_00880 [Chloroflexi bacterium RBG_16_60_22]